MRAELNVEQPDGSWLWREYRIRSRIELKSIDCELVLKDLCTRVEFGNARNQEETNVDAGLYRTTRLRNTSRLIAIPSIRTSLSMAASLLCRDHR